MKLLALIIAATAARHMAARAASLPRRWLLQRETQAAYRQAVSALARYRRAHPVRVEA